MERRTLLKPMKKTEPKKEEEPPQINDFKEEEVFVKKKEKKEEEPPEIIEPEVEHEIEIDEIAPEVKEVMEKEIVLEQKKKRKKRVLTDAMKENLKRMNQKSAEVRRQKKEEKMKEEARLKKEIQDEREEKMKLKVRKEMEEEKNNPLPSLPPPSLPAKERGVHVPEQVSGIKDVHHGVENYDRLIEGVMGALRSDKYITQLERDIRTDERRKTEMEYKEKLDKYEKEQHKKHQRELGFSLLQGQPMRRNNSTFSRTQMLKDRWGKR